MFPRAALILAAVLVTLVVAIHRTWVVRTISNLASSDARRHRVYEVSQRIGHAGLG